MSIKALARRIAFVLVPNWLTSLDVRRLNNRSGWCWHCEWPHLGTICPIHKVKMQPLNRHSFKSSRKPRSPQ